MHLSFSIACTFISLGFFYFIVICNVFRPYFFNLFVYCACIPSLIMLFSYNSFHISSKFSQYTHKFSPHLEMSVFFGMISYIAKRVMKQSIHIIPNLILSILQLYLATCFPHFLRYLFLKFSPRKP